MSAPFFMFLFFFSADFATIEQRNIAIDKMTMVPPGAKLNTYEITIPPSTEKTAIETEISAVFLNPFPNVIAEIFGITINEDISSTPTRRTEAMTVKLARTINR